MEYVRLFYLSLPDIWALVLVEVGTAPNVWKTMREEVVRVASALMTMPVVEELWWATIVLMIVKWV